MLSSLLWGSQEIFSALKCLTQSLLFSGWGSWACMKPQDICQKMVIYHRTHSQSADKQRNLGFSSCLEVCVCVCTHECVRECMACKHAYISMCFSSPGKYIAYSNSRWLFIIVITFLKDGRKTSLLHLLVLLIYCIVKRNRSVTGALTLDPGPRGPGASWFLSNQGLIYTWRHRWSQLAAIN